MLTHPRYGMGKRLGAADVDKWALYVIGQYCDQSVPDGFGGTEPRITCNAYLTTQRKAWDVLSDFCSAMRCMPRLGDGDRACGGHAGHCPLRS
ncbi:Putative tail component of prophage [Escherichia coli]|nr:Putative tail component of prophage [Escherichia coli]